MLHAAAQGTPYKCFVRPDTQINFMAMPDAVQALLQLAGASANNLSKRVYNISSFSLSADEFRDQVVQAFPKAEIDYEVHEKRQRIVDSWPKDTDDSGARRDWGWKPEYNLERCFKEYLIPNILKLYS
jgi:nucleoside-diphosphate-sugar epimerase